MSGMRWMSIVKLNTKEQDDEMDGRASEFRMEKDGTYCEGG